MTVPKNRSIVREWTRARERRRNSAKQCREAERMRARERRRNNTKQRRKALRIQKGGEM